MAMNAGSKRFPTPETVPCLVNVRLSDIILLCVIALAQVQDCSSAKTEFVPHGILSQSQLIPCFTSVL